MESLLFVVAAIALYFAADWVLQRIELALGRRLEYRTLVFFGLLLGMAVLTFSAIQRVLGS